MPDSENNEATGHTQSGAALPQPKEQKLLPASTGPQKNMAVGAWRKWVLLLILLLAAALIYVRIRDGNKEKAKTEQQAVAAANRPIPVTVTPVAAKTMPVYLTALGTVTAYNTVTVKSRVDGQLLSVNVREGQQVKMGQVLAMIDPRPYLAAQAQAEGQLAKDQAAADYSKSEAGRYTALYEAGVVSKESEQTQVSNAGASVGTLAADRAAIQAAKVNVAYTRITSPINGVVGLRQVDAGNIVHASDANGLLVVTQLQPITVIFTLPEDQLQQVLQLVRGGHKLVVDAYDRAQATKLASGTLLTVDNQIDTTTGTVKVKAVFDNKDGALFPNQFVNVRLILDMRQNSLVVPAAALQTGVNGTFVYVAKPGTPPVDPNATSVGRPIDGVEGQGSTSGGAAAVGSSGGHKGAGKGGAARGGAGSADAHDNGPKYYVQVQNVTVDLTEGSQVILKGGVKPGDLVVIDGEEKLKPYSPVTPKQGLSNAGGPASQSIGSDSASNTAPPADASGAGSQNSSGTNARGGGSRANGSGGGAH